MTIGIHRLTCAGLALSLFAIIGAYAQTQPTRGESSRQTGNRVVLVELFTSEGCSSCPPADELLRQIDGKTTEAGDRIIGISEHVTYWNYLGWSDRFSSKVFSERQYAYAQRFHLDSVYTPQMVIDGQEQLVGSDQTRLLEALLNDEAPKPIVLHIDTAALRSHKLTFQYSVTGTIPKNGADLFVAVVDDTDQSNVSRGENSGHILMHVSVARLLARVAEIRSPVKQSAEIALPGSGGFSMPVKRHLILFAQAKDMGKILGVDSIPL